MLSKFSVKKPLTIIVVVIIVIILGVVSYTSIGVDLYPDMSMPYLMIATILPGASPEEIESTVTEPMEAEISAMSGISTMTSLSSEHLSLIILELNTDEDLDSFISDLNTTLDTVAWPDSDYLQEPIIIKADPSILPIMTISLGRDDYTIQESTDYFEAIINEIDSVSGVSSVTTSGLVSNMVFVNVDADKMASSLVDSFAEILGIDIELPEEVKEQIRVALQDMFEDALNDPAYQDENGKVDAEKLLDDMIIPYVEDLNMGDIELSDDVDTSMLSTLSLFKDDIVAELKGDTVVRSSALLALETIIDNSYVLEDGEANKEIFYALLDDVVAEIVSNVSNELLGDMSSMLTVDLFELLFTAQNFEMPAGSITLGESTWIVKVGDEIATRDELYELPLMTIDLSSTISDYVEQIQSVIQIISSETEDGKAEISKENLESLSSYIYMYMNPTLDLDDAQTEDVSLAYATWAAGMIASDLSDEYQLTADEITEWAELISQNEAFAAVAKDVAENNPSDWRSTVLDAVYDNYYSGTLYLDSWYEESAISLGAYLDDLASSSIGANSVRYEVYLQSGIIATEMSTTEILVAGFLESALEDAGIDDETLSMFDGMNEDEIYNYITGMLVYVGDFTGEGVVVETEDGYIIDFDLLYANLDAMEDSLKITMTLGDVSDISFLDDAGSQIATLITNVDGEFVSSSSVQIYIEKESDASTATVTTAVEELLNNLAESDSDFTFAILDNDGELIDMMVSGVLSNLVYGAIFAAVVLLFFLKKVRATLIVASSILISVVATFVMMYFSGMTLNVISMGGLTLGVGMLVDNSIVVLENIYRMRSQGKSVYVSAVQGAKQISPAIIASTITTIIVFLPVLFIDGITQQVISDMALTITFALCASLLSALCVVPMAASWLKNDKPTQDGKIFVAIKKAYAKTLNKCLNHKWVVIVLVITLFGVSALGATTLGMEFFTTADEGGLTISVEIDTATLSTMNVGVSKSSEDYYTYDMAVEETVAIIESVLTSYDEVETIGIAYSSGMTVSGITIGDTTITATVGLCDYRDRDDSTVEIIADITSALAMKSNSLFTFSIVENTAMDTVSTFVNDDITLSYYSDDITTLTTTGSDLTALISEIPGVTSVSDGSSSDDQQYYIVIDKAKASEYGLTVATAYLQIASLITAPSSSTSITIDSIELADETEDYAVYILDTSYTGLAWYRAYNSTGTDYTRIYFENNLGDIGVDADYYALNNGKSSIFVKHNGEIVEVAVGDYIPLTYIDGAFTYEYAVVTEYVDTNDAGENVTLHEVSYETVSYTVSDYTTYSTYFTDDIDLVMLEMVTEDLFGTEGFEAEPFYLYEILSDESFVKDADGNIVYRTSSTTEQIPSDIALIDGYSSIYREDGQRMGTITITYDTLNYTSDEINAAINTILDEYELTSHGDLVIDRDTSNAIMTEVFNTLYLVLGLAIVLIYLVMVAQFQSLKSPFIIMFTIPLAFTGSLALLYILGFEMSILALLGLIVLMGIVVNNGIVFVDYANKLIENGTPKREALIRTGIDRIRPILMTALTTIMAMLVMAVDTSIQGIMLQPLAIGVIGGLAYATLLTLFFVPIIYDLFNRKEKDLTRINALKSDEMEEAALEEGEDKLMPTEQAIVDGVLLAQSDYASKIATQKAKKDKKKNKYKQIKLEAKREKVLQKILDSRED